MGDDFTNAIIHFFKTGELNQGLNATSIALIPKFSTPMNMKDFIPISLCSIAYKCITKIIAGRLKLVMTYLVGNSQSTFIPGRHITDNILMAQELFRGYGR